MSNAWVQSLIIKHHRQGVLFDANLLFVLCLASIEDAFGVRFRNASTHTENDVLVLRDFASRFQKRWTTPNVVTEVSNLISSRLNRHYSSKARHALKQLVSSVIEERYVESVAATNHRVFEPLGLTDAALAVLADEGTLVVSNDQKLCDWVVRSGASCVYYDEQLKPR